MGIRGLNYFLKKYAHEAIKKTHLSKYKNKIVAIDANLYLYKFLYKNGNHLSGLFYQINKLKKFNIKPIYIFDGKPPKEKKYTLNERYTNKENIKIQINELENNIKNNLYSSLDLQQILNKIQKLKSRLIYVNKEVIDKSIELFNLMGVHYIFATCEAEHYCAKLIRYNIVDLVLSDDMDTLCCGSKITIRNYNNRTDYITEYNLEVILKLLNITYFQFIDLCILFGNDYIKIYNNLDVYKNYLLIKKYMTLENILLNNIIKQDINVLQNIKNIYKLTNIELNTNDILYINSYNKKKIYKLKDFLKNNTNIDKKIYNNLIYKMFYIKTKLFKNKCLENNYYLKLIEK